MMGMGAGAVGGLVQPAQASGPFAGQGQSPQAQSNQGGAEPNPAEKLAQFKQMLDQGLITEADYEAAKKKALGL